MDMFRALTVVAACGLPAVVNAHEYGLDDGSGNVNIGPAFEADVLWGNYFFVEDDQMLITDVRVALGSIDPGLEIELFVFDDPDDDGDPLNALPLTSVTSTTGAPDDDDEFISYPVTPVEVVGGFFIAARMNLDSGLRPARLDWDTVVGRSWLFYDGEIDPDNLRDSPYILNMDDAPFPGTWMLRAGAIPAPTSAIALMGVWGLGCRRR